MRVRTSTLVLFWAMALAILPVFSSPRVAEAAGTVPDGFVDEHVTSVGEPTALAFTPDGGMLIAVKPGQLLLRRNEANSVALDISSKICDSGEQGLLGVAVDPAYSSNGYIYVYYTVDGASGCVNRVSRFTMSGGSAAAGSEYILIHQTPYQSATNHNAGDLHFGKDGYLYITVGDGGCDYASPYGCAGSNDAARDRNTLLGKVLRITKTGGIPADNPFTGSNSGRCNVTGRTSATWCQETYAWGLRNPFRFAFDPNSSTTRFFINDVGQGAWEEIDLGTKGGDYGWNCREGNHDNPSSSCPDSDSFTDPISEYSHATGCASITGGAFVPDGVWPGYNGSYMYADYVCGKIFRRSSTGALSTFASGLGGSSAVHMAFGPAGSTQALYYTTYEGGGSVRRIRYTDAPNRAPVASLKASPTSGPLPLAVSFDGTGSRDPDGDPLTYEWDFTSDGMVNSRAATTNYTYSTKGVYTATLRVRDAAGAVGTATVEIQAGNTAPSPTITSPATTKLFRVGETITLSGSATDEQDGTLASSRLSWNVVQHHGTHTHPFYSGTGNNLTFAAPAPEDLAATTNSYLTVRLTATDSQGLSQTVAQRLNPKKVGITFATSPTGLKVGVNGASVSTTRTLTSWYGYRLNVSAPTQKDSAGITWAFDKWSDGGTASHTIVTPSSAKTYTATFRRPTKLTLAASPTLTSYNGQSTLTGTLTTAEGVLANRIYVRLYRSVDGGRTWTDSGSVPYNSATRTYTVTARALRNTTYQMRYAGNSTFKPSRSAGVLVKVRAYLSQPVAPAEVTKGTAFTVYGYLKPYHSGTTRLQFFRYVNGAWQFYTGLDAPNGAYNGYTKYSKSVSLPYSGRWYVRAYHSDADHAPTYSPIREFAVR